MLLSADRVSEVPAGTFLVAFNAASSLIWACLAMEARNWGPGFWPEAATASNTPDMSSTSIDSIPDNN
jgi:hypothetical protein